MVDTSNLEKFYKKSMEERVQIISEKCSLSSDEVSLLTSLVDPGGGNMAQCTDIGDAK